MFFGLSLRASGRLRRSRNNLYKSVSFNASPTESKQKMPELNQTPRSGNGPYGSLRQSAGFLVGIWLICDNSVVQWKSPMDKVVNPGPGHHHDEVRRKLTE
jgi:hypothetical protein